MTLFNQNSLTITLIAGFLLLVVMLWRWQTRSVILRVGIALWYIFGALLIALAVQYPRLDTTPTTVAQVEALLNNQRPTFVMLYSNY